MSEFRNEPDLNDPAQLYAELVDHENALLRQAESSGNRTGAQGHPHPEYFFNRVARAIAAAAVKIKPMIPAPVPEPIPEVEHVTDAASVAATTVTGTKSETKNKK